MATVQTQTFTDLVRGQVVAIQGAAAGIVDFTVGSIMRAIVEANAQVALWLQGIALTILSVTRAATSVGPDLDSWMADFDFERDQAFAAFGMLLFSRFTATQTALVAVGATAETADGSEQYVVTADPTNTLWNAALNGYSLPAGTASASVPATCTTAGAAGNAAAGAINTITQAMPGIDTVTNQLAFENGADAEIDPAFRVRFRGYIGSLSKATQQAIEFALSTLGADVDYTAVENQSYAGIDQPGYFFVVVDDGTGSPSAEFLANASAAVDATRAFTVGFGVYAPVIVGATVSMSVQVAAGYAAADVQSAVNGALSLYIDGLGLGATLPYSRLAQIAYDASKGVANVTNVLLNGWNADLAPTDKQVIKVGSLAVAAA